MELTKQKNITCPHCGEVVKQHWKLCPVCETPRWDARCPGCGMEILAHWNICPECHTRLSGALTLKNHKPDQTNNNPDSWTDPQSGIVFLKVPGGSFMMGDNFNEGLENEGPLHEVLLDDFYLARTPVTRLQWQQVTGKEGGSPSLGLDHPVTHVDYDAISNFISLLNDHHGTSRNFNLASEAQWEYAARSGGKHQRYSGSDVPEPVAWYGDNSDGHPHKVALKKPNDLGFYDMSGNVWEWCRDVFSDLAYDNHDHRNPMLGSDHQITDHVARGGSWMMDAWSLRCTRRFSFPENASGNGLGFRPVMIVC
ncbi:MAG: SUMF1/EgtB/PvdO family nonheme iron enzyme [Proteobacteria bacterium]|nr:SUMF1/EgtB/PvdO family nonheme iron enzyme [Pseudomonadota bacterium]